MTSTWLDPAFRPLVSQRATVVLVHGAIVRGWEMRLLQHRLSRLGYLVRQFRYRSMLRGLQHNVARLKKFLSETEGDALHVVCHSMGGVLTREVFEQTPDPRPGRLIAIGSPFLDCWVARRICLERLRMGRYMVGKTVYDHITRTIDPVWRGQRDLGVIAGTYCFGIGATFRSFPEPSDGVVLLDETRLQGIRDHIIFHINHFGMLFSRRCCAEIARFLATGQFSSSPQPAASDLSLAGVRMSQG